MRFGIRERVNEFLDNMNEEELKLLDSIMTRRGIRPVVRETITMVPKTFQSGKKIDVTEGSLLIYDEMTPDARAERSPGMIICDGCRSPFRRPNRRAPITRGEGTFYPSHEFYGVVFTGWIFAEVDDENEPTGGLLGSGKHAGPWAYCRDCFLGALGWR